MTPYKYMPFEKTRMVIINNEKDHKEKRDFLYGFHFFRTQKKYKICTNDKELFDSLKEILIYKTIQHTFHEEYDVQKLIGKGSFAKVILLIKL